MPEPEPREEQPIVVRRDRQRRPAPRYTWLLLVLIALFLAFGILLVTTGLLAPTGDSGEMPGPTAFTLTPQVEVTETLEP